MSARKQSLSEKCVIVRREFRSRGIDVASELAKLTHLAMGALMVEDIVAHGRTEPSAALTDNIDIITGLLPRLVTAHKKWRKEAKKLLSLQKKVHRG